MRRGVLDSAVKAYLRHLELERFLAPSSVRGYRYQLECTFRDLPETFSDEELGRHIARRIGPEAGSVFIKRNTYLALNGFYRWWGTRGGYPNPVAEARVPHPPKISRSGLTELELREVLERLPDRPLKEQAMVRLILHDGFRVGDVVRLEVGDIDFGHKRIRARWRKGGVGQELPMGDDLADVLHRYLTEYRILSGYVFTGPKGRMVEQSVWKAFKRAVGDKLVHLKPHQGRHSFATALGREVKADIKSVQHLLGHENLKTTEVYFDRSPAHEEAAIIDLETYYRKLKASGE